MKKKLIVFLLILSLLLPCFVLTSFAEPDEEEQTQEHHIQLNASSYGDDLGGVANDNLYVYLSEKNNYTASISFYITACSHDHTLKKIEKINGNTITLVKSNEDGKKVNLIEDTILYSEPGDKVFIYKDVEFDPEDAGREIIFRLTWLDDEGNEQISECTYETYKDFGDFLLGVYPDKTVSVPDDEIEITYRVLSNTDKDLSFFTLTDESLSGLVSSTTLITPQTLEANGSIIKTVTITPQKNLTLSPRIFYSLDNEVYEDDSFSLPILVGEMVPEVTLTCEDYSPDKAGSTQIFNYTIKNNNPIAIENIRIYDSDTDDAKLVHGPFTLGSGEEYSGSYEVQVWNSGYYKCKLTFKSTSDSGTTELSIRSDKAIELPADVLFKIASISPETITESGYVTFKLLIENGTADMLEDITISEEHNLFAPVSLNLSLPSAIGSKKSTTSKEISVLINSDNTNLNFLLSYTVNGEHFSAELPYEVKFNTSLEVPSNDNPQQNTEEKDNSLLIWILICVCVLIIIALVIILLFIFRSRAKVEQHAPAARRRVIEDYSDDEEYFEDEEDNFDSEEDEIDDEGVKIFKKHN